MPIVIVTTFLEAPLACVKRIESLNPFNMVANVFIGFSLLVILGFAMGRLARDGVEEGVVMSDTSNFYLFVGTAVFAFEGAISLTIPCCNSVVPSDRANVMYMYMVTIFAIWLFYTCESSSSLTGRGHEPRAPARPTVTSFACLLTRSLARSLAHPLIG